VSRSKKASTLVWGLAWLGAFACFEWLGVSDSSGVPWFSLSEWVWWLLDTRPWFPWLLGALLVWLPFHFFTRGREFAWLSGLMRRIKGA
jgi:hypothetical protein